MQGSGSTRGSSRLLVVQGPAPELCGGGSGEYGGGDGDVVSGGR